MWQKEIGLSNQLCREQTFDDTDTRTMTSYMRYENFQPISAVS